MENSPIAGKTLWKLESVDHFSKLNQITISTHRFCYFGQLNSDIAFYVNAINKYEKCSITLVAVGEQKNLSTVYTTNCHKYHHDQGNLLLRPLLATTTLFLYTE